MERPNFYILLELAPSETDPAKIDLAIRKKQTEWSRDQNHPKKRLQAKQYLELLKDIRTIMADPARREDEAREAARQHKEREKTAARELDEAIKVVAGEGYLLEQHVAQLVKRFQGRFTEADIRGRITVEIRPDGAGQPPPRPQIDMVLAKDISNSLKTAEKKDLYDFLGLPRTSSLKALLDRGRALGKDVQNNNNKTAKVTAEGQLVGYCLKLFGNESDREKYNNTLDLHRLRELDPDIETAGADRELKATGMTQLLHKALEKGVSEDEARRYILEFAAAKKWSVLVPQGSVADRQQSCGVCGALNDARAKKCGACGEPLTVECPKCRTVNPSKNRNCSQCGFSVGDAPLVRRLLRDAELALARDDTRQAEQMAKEALVYWPGAPEAESLLRKVAQRREEEESAYRQIREAVTDHRFCEARRLLSGFLVKRPDHPERAKLEKEIETALRTAKAHAARARGLEQAGRVDDAVDAYVEALRVCKDLEEARDGLAKCPPDAPRDLQLTGTVRAIVLHWKPSPSRGEPRYKVLRKGGSEPRSAEDGQVIAETADTLLTDSEALPGEVYYYAVYAERGGALSVRAAIGGPILRVAEVADLCVTAGDRCTTLLWQPPARATHVEVWRMDAAPPQRRGIGTRLTAVSLNSAADAGLSNGVMYGYRVVALFEGVDGKPAYAHGVTITAIPAEPPRPVTDLAVVRRAGDFEATWTPPALGEVQVFASPDRPAGRCGDLLSASDLGTLGRRVPSRGPGVARGTAATEVVLHLVPVTVAGSMAVIGQPVSLTWVEDVDELSVTVKEDVLLARWHWPKDIETVLVALRKDRFPTGPADPRATPLTCVRFKYDREGGFRKSVPTTDRIYVVVYAMVNREGECSYASGATPGARKEVARHCTVKYRLAPKSRLWGLGKTGEWILTITPDADTELPELLLVIKGGGIPLHPRNGTAVLEIPAGSSCAPDQALIIPFQTDGLPSRWRAKLFPARDEDCEWLELVDES